MKFLLIAAAAAVSLQKADLPYDGAIDKVDPLSRYVNDDDIVQLEDDVRLVQTTEEFDQEPVVLVMLKKADLPHDGSIDKVDPLSRYVNDDDLVMHESTLLQMEKADLPYDGPFDKVDPLSRYVNDDDI